MLEIVYRYDPTSGEPERPTDWEQAHDKLVAGNRWFSELTVDGGPRREVVHSNVGGLGISNSPDSLPKHSPFAAVLSCSDARVPVELIFHRAVNELFGVRLAGNVVTTESVGSLSYAARHLDGSVKLITVLGHTNCGAVSAAVDAYLDPTNLSGATDTLGLRTIIERLFVAVRIAAKGLGQSPQSTETEYRKRLIGSSVVVNAALSSMRLKHLLGDTIPHDCRIVYGVYDIGTRQVRALQRNEDDSAWGICCLADPPSSYDLLDQLAAHLASDPNTG